MTASMDVHQNSEIKGSLPEKNGGIEQDARSEMDIGKVEDITSSSQLDEAEIFLRENGYDWATADALLQDESTVKKLVRKVDLMILPLLCGTFCLQYIDKQAMSYGAVFDLFKKAHISSDQYSWLGSLFYFGKILLSSQVPSTRTYYRPRLSLLGISSKLYRTTLQDRKIHLVYRVRTFYDFFFSICS